MNKHNYYVYMMASVKNGVIYIGVTGDLAERIYRHKNNLGSEFTSEYKVYKLVYYKRFEQIEDAIRREKQMKKWRRQWKINLIEENNPGWEDLCGRL